MMAIYLVKQMVTGGDEISPSHTGLDGVVADDTLV